MFLYEKLDALKQFQWKDFFQRAVNNEIKGNLNNFIQLREYQQEALGRFFFYYENYAEKPLPVHLLFNMATWSWKTVIMAWIILYLYQKWYRNFLFFVNATNIIEKTKDNFLNTESIKYLFWTDIIIDEKRIDIKAVNNFQWVNEDNINIKFTTIQWLHSDLNTPKENTLTIDDFQKSKIVILSDEAHHINALTKWKDKETQIEKETREHTVTKIINSHIENIMLEFTATVDRNHPEITKKYEEKTIYRYDLKQFRLDKFSKEVKTLQADVTPLQRMLQAIVLSHYRRKIAEQHHIWLKPVVLIKSKTIKESEDNFTEFKTLVQNLSSTDIDQIKSIGVSDDMQKVRRRFSEKWITSKDIAKELKVEFDTTKLVEINGKQDSIDKQILVNTLEASNNQIRCIFAVDMLNEWRDVLNLYDIVRLDESRAWPSGKGTTKEAQLIGRWARYYPFTAEETQDKYTRKYDEDINNELRILEEMHYHCINNPKYIHELKKELEKIGIYDTNKKEVEIKVKEDFRSSDFFKSAVLYINKKQKSDRTHITTVFEANVKKEYTHIIKTWLSQTSVIFQNEMNVTQERRKSSMKLSDIERSLLQRAIEAIDDYSFDRIKKYVWSFTDSIDTLIKSNFSTISILIDWGIYEQLSQTQKYDLCLDILQQITNDLKNGYSEYEWTKRFEHQFIHKIVTNKKISVSIDENNDRKVWKPMKEDSEYGYMDLMKKKRYVYEENYGTDEEKALVAFIDRFYDHLKEKYTNIYLLRNEKIFQLYRFSDWKALEPDFVLFAEEKESKTPITYQLYIEPKWEHLIKTDSRKEVFLQEIEPWNYEIHKMFLVKQQSELY